MNRNSKVLWGEGLFLRPHHFQQQDHYHEQRVRYFAERLQPFAWGIVQIQCDTDALSNGFLRLNALTVVFQDGEIVMAPAEDALPETIDLNATPSAVQSLTYYVALPRVNPQGRNLVSPTDEGASSQTIRYSTHSRELHDAYTQALPASINILKREIRLMSELEPRDAFETVAALRVNRTATGGFALDTEFVPPCMHIESSDYLMTQLRRLMDALQAKVSALHGHHREPSRHVIEFRSGDVSSFWLLHTASTAFAALSHYLHQPGFHPERLFEQLLSLAGALLTYSKSYALVDLPVYRHDKSSECFAALLALIRELLDTVISARYFAIALREVKSGFFHGQLDSGKLDDSSTLYIAVSADMPALELAELVPLRFKIGTPEDVDKLVLSAMPGVKLTHAAQVPAAIPVRPDTLYFSLDRKGPLYERMLQAQSISIYVPSGLSNLHLELMAVT